MTEVSRDTGDEGRVKAEEDQAFRVRQREIAELRVLLNTCGGRAFVWRLLSQCGVYRMSFRGDIHEGLVNEGSRKIGLWTLDEVFTADANVYTLMRNEADERARQFREVESDG